MNEPQRPIGYWLKHLDGLIERAFDDALGREGVSRRHWQAMNVVRDAPVDNEGLAEALHPFWKEGSISADVANDLLRRGWVTRDASGRYALTASGESAYGRVAKEVEGIRAAIADGLTQEEYEATLRVLRRMAENLEAARAELASDRSHGRL